MVLSNGMAQGPGATEAKCELSHGRNLLSECNIFLNYSSNLSRIVQLGYVRISLRAAVDSGWARKATCLKYCTGRSLFLLI